LYCILNLDGTSIRLILLALSGIILKKYTICKCCSQTDPENLELDVFSTTHTLAAPQPLPRITQIVQETPLSSPKLSSRSTITNRPRSIIEENDYIIDTARNINLNQTLALLVDQMKEQTTQFKDIQGYLKRNSHVDSPESKRVSRLDLSKVASTKTQIDRERSQTPQNRSLI
jgi:hypothetical protein